jgi:hypothetical protein
MAETTLETMSIEKRTFEHECPYNNAKEDFMRRIGKGGLERYRVAALESELIQIHQDTICPPTHIDHGPTRVWADWVQTLRR